jgi:hypothetical protein
MNDSNSAAELANDQAQIEKQARYEAHAPSVIDGIVDDVLSGRIIKCAMYPLNWSAPDFFPENLHEFCNADDIAVLLFGGSNRRMMMRERLTYKFADLVRDWCKDTPAGQALVEKRIEEIGR